ncbi:MAG TPA: hypothetical protein VGG74_23850 [Kofleriaceae bacterium]|jgi:hypothetical protein
MLSCDEHGIVTGFSYHDGFLDGVLVSDDGTAARFAVRSIEGVRRILTLRGVVSLHLDGFRQGNIVGYMWLLRGDQASANLEVRRLLIEELGRPALPEATLAFVIDTSYGANVIAICATAEISEPGVTLDAASSY